MFCPSCGRDDSHKRRFCPSCGTNLEAISRTLSENQEGAFVKVGKSLDGFIGRYAEHVFKDAPARALDHRVGSSWLVLGQGILTSLFDLALFCVMTLLLPFRFVSLLLNTPVRLLTERSRNRRNAAPEIDRTDRPELPGAQHQERLPASFGSVTDHTTVSLSERNRVADAHVRKG